MCGIVGIINFSGEKIDRDQVQKMTDALTHRGPDGNGVYLDGNVGLGHTRLSIIDLSDAAAQPMTSEDGNVTIVYNGEIYNFQEERSLLEQKGHRFTSTGDTEVLLHLYQEYGEGCIERLRGMFAFAIYDKEKQKIFMARDRTGQKPLKYFAIGNTFAFASEQKALDVLPECPKEIDEEAIHHFLTLTYLPAPFTGKIGIHKLPAGHLLRIDLQNHKWEIEQYWHREHRDDHRSLEEWEEQIMHELEDAVRMRMIADVPLGAFLSGGIDSATIVGLMSTLHDQPIKTFSMGAAGDPKSEIDDAARIAKHFGTDHTPLEVEPDIVHLLPELVHTYEEPFGDPSVIPTYLICRETKQYVTVALSGDGGDENFGGYARYPILQVSRFWEKFPKFFHSAALCKANIFHKLARNTFSYRSLTFNQSINRDWHQRHLQYLGAFNEDEKRQLYTSKLQQHQRTDNWFTDRTTHFRTGNSTVQQAMSLDFNTYLPDDLLPKVDLGAMAHSLEVRSPFLDHKLLELTAGIPSPYLVKRLQTKWLMKHMVKDLLPRETLQKKKQGFRLGLHRWFQHDLKDFVNERVLDAPAPFWQIFEKPKVEQFLKQYQQSNVDLSPQIWLLLWLAEWFEQQHH